jgi:hypothetical protein
MKYKRSYNIYICTVLLLFSNGGRSQSLVTGFDKTGISLVRYKETILLNSVSKIGSVLTTEGYKVIHKGGKAEGGWSALITLDYDDARQTYHGNYNWGTLEYRYTQVNDTLYISLKLTNTSKTDTLCGVNIYPFHLVFPQRPVGFVQYNFYYHYNLDGPTVVPVNFGTGKLILCNEDVASPLFVGLLDKRPEDGGGYKCWVSSIPFHGFENSAPQIEHRIAPGKSETYTISLRFCGPGENEIALAKNILSRYRSKWPMQLVWKDRRPLGYLVLSSVENKADKLNPRGWLPGNVVDVTTASGCALFQKKVLAYADRSIENLKKMNAQGMITWDIEGQEFPHPYSYVGSPEQLHALAPEMDVTAGLYFKKFKEAGFKTGICIRPDSIIFNRAANSFKRVEVRDVVQTLARKIKFASKQWGCTLFYVDSNGYPGYPMSPDIFKRLNELFPVFLVIPEHKSERYYAYTAPLMFSDGDELQVPLLVSETYPGAFQSVNISYLVLNKKNDRSKHAGLVKAAADKKNILMFQAWFDDTDATNLIKQAY